MLIVLKENLGMEKHAKRAMAQAMYTPTKRYLRPSEHRPS